MMPDENNLKDLIKEPVKDLTAEIISGIVFRITRAGTKRAARELRKKLKKEALSQIKDELEAGPGQELNRFITGSEERINRELCREGVTKERIDSNIRREFGKRITKQLSHYKKSPVLKILAASAAVIIVLGVVIVAIVSGSEPDEVKPPATVPVDTVPPELGVYVSTEMPQPGEIVTFTVEASDDEELAWMELLINGEVVGETAVSPLVYTGGPFEMGSTVVYEARAYDTSGNRAWTGERMMRVAAMVRLPDLVILETSHEWIDMREGLIAIRYIVQNRGDGEAGPSLTTLHFGDEIIGKDTVKALAPGETAEREFPQIQVPERFEVRLCVDSGNVIEELDENNNCADYGA